MVRVHDHRVHLSYHEPAPPEAADLIESCNGLLKIQIRQQFRDRTPQAGSSLRCTVPTSDIRYCTTTAKIYGSRDEGMEVKLAPLSITRSNSLHFHFCAFHSYSLGSAGLEVLVSNGAALPPGIMVRVPFH